MEYTDKIHIEDKIDSKDKDFKNEEDINLNKPNDSFDELGRNISSQRRRENKTKWTIVKKKNKKFY